MTTFFEIDEMLVWDEIFRKVLEFEQLRITWKRKPNADSDRLDVIVDRWIDEQVTRYAEVRISKGPGGYRLVYPGSSDGTGPFSSQFSAQGFFLRGGR